MADADVQGERAGTRTDDWARSAGLEKAVLIGEGAKASVMGSASAAATTAFFMSILHGCTRRVRMRRPEVGKSVLWAPLQNRRGTDATQHHALHNCVRSQLFRSTFEHAPRRSARGRWDPEHILTCLGWGRS